MDVGGRWPFLNDYPSGGIDHHFIGNDVSEPTFTAVGAEGDEIGPGSGIIVSLPSDGRFVNRPYKTVMGSDLMKWHVALG